MKNTPSGGSMKMNRWIVMGIVTVAIFIVNQSDADVLARYNFNGRTDVGQRTIRPHDALSPYDGSNYVADVSMGEFGPVLENPGGGGVSDYYQSYYNNRASEYTTKRETLEMARTHHQYPDRYRTAAGEGMVPITGSFTWESIVRVLSTIGVTTGGRLNVCWFITSNFRENIGTPENPDIRNRGVQFRFDNYDSEAGTYEAVFTIVRNVYAHSTSVIATNLSVNNYHHFACVYDDDKNMMHLYVDEELVGSAGVTSYTRTNEVGICGWSINAESTMSAGAMRGFIDDLAFTDDVRRPGNFVLGIHGTLIVIH